MVAAHRDCPEPTEPPPSNGAVENITVERLHNGYLLSTHTRNNHKIARWIATTPDELRDIIVKVLQGV